MSDALLLPSSSTGLERDLSASMDALPRLGAAAELIRDAKRENIPDSVVPFLLYEYGLGELLPYLSDPRTAISTGVLWQRLRGTPKSFSIALGWIGNDGTIEESEGNTINWSQFQLGLDSAPVDLSQTDSVVEIGRLSSPVRSSLFRIYGGWYDGRRFQLDDHKLSSLDTLCDHTGVYLKSEWPQLSFGREFKDEQGDISGDLAAALGVHRFSGISGRYEDRTILSNSILGETSWRTLHIEDLSSVISRLHFSVSGPWWNNATDWQAAYDWTQVLDWAGLQNKFTPALKFARAGMYLSDYAELGDTNACLPARSLDEFGDGAVLLSEANPDTGEHILSEHLSRVEFTEINERFDVQTELGSMWVGGGNSQVQVETHQLQHGQAYASANHPNPPEHATLISTLSHYNGSRNNRHNTSETVFGDGAGHTLGRGEEFTTLGKTNFADGDPSHGYPERFDLSSLVIDDAAETISAVDTNGTTHTRPLFNQDGIRRVTEFRNVSGNTAQVFIGAPITLLPSHREHTRELAYDDSFELSRSRLSEYTPLINEQAISRGHTTSAELSETQSAQWQFADDTWEANTWESEASQEWFDETTPVDTWASVYSWKSFPQLEQILGFSLAGICLSETGFLSDGQSELGDTQATLSFTTSERFERSHQAEASHVGSVHLRGETSVVLKRERSATLSYYDVFILSLSRLDEVIDLSQVTSNTRAHKTSFLQIPLQSGQWELATETWSGPDDWNTEAGWFSDTPENSTWNNRYAWQNFPQLEQVLGFSRTMLTLSETGHLSDSDGILGNTHATLGFFEDERIERSHQTTSAAHDPSGFFYHLRERFATLAYDDLFELSRTRLDEFIPLVNQQAITREHGSAAAWHTEQFNSWADTSPSWAAASDWQTGGYFDAANEPTWFEAYAWQVFPQLEHVLSFHQSHQYLSDTTDGLSETDAVLGFEFSQRFERDHFAQATEDRQSFTTRQHVRTYYPATVALYIEPTWASGDWAGEDATDWHETTEDWQAGSWASLDWVDSSTITWANQFMWGRIARWQIASLVVESVHETHA